MVEVRVSYNFIIYHTGSWSRDTEGDCEEDQPLIKTRSVSYLWGENQTPSPAAHLSTKVMCTPAHGHWLTHRDLSVLILNGAFMVQSRSWMQRWYLFSSTSYLCWWDQKINCEHTVISSTSSFTNTEWESINLDTSSLNINNLNVLIMVVFFLKHHFSIRQINFFFRP